MKNNTIHHENDNKLFAAIADFDLYLISRGGCSFPYDHQRAFVSAVFQRFSPGGDECHITDQGIFGRWPHCVNN